jgi:uncharacterized membrane protein YuzA (DUF378 family)
MSNLDHNKIAKILGSDTISISGPIHGLAGIANLSNIYKEMKGRSDEKAKRSHRRKKKRS